MWTETISILQVRITKGKLSNVIKSSNGNYTRDDCLAHIRALIDVHCDLLLKYSTIPITDILRESAEVRTTSDSHLGSKTGQQIQGRGGPTFVERKGTAPLTFDTKCFRECGFREKEPYL